MWLFLATELSEVPERPAADEDERIETVPWPRARLDDAIGACEDSKSLIALLWLKAANGPGAGGAP